MGFEYLWELNCSTGITFDPGDTWKEMPELTEEDLALLADMKIAVRG